MSLPTAGPLAYRTAGPPDGPPVLLLHGWPQSSWMWRAIVEALGEAGFRAIAPDFPGYGDSMARRPATWHTHMEALHEFFSALAIDSAALVVHDWGGLIGLRWACDHPGVANTLVISDTGLFPDGRWHGFAKVLQTPGDGEAGDRADDPRGIRRRLRPGQSRDDRRRPRRVLPPVRRRRRAARLNSSSTVRATSRELEPYEGKLAALGVPTLMLWGETDPFAPIGGAHRFEREIPGSAEADVDGDATASADFVAARLTHGRSNGTYARSVHPSTTRRQRPGRPSGVTAWLRSAPARVRRHTMARCPVEMNDSTGAPPSRPRAPAPLTVAAASGGLPAWMRPVIAAAQAPGPERCRSRACPRARRRCRRSSTSSS